MRAPLPLLMLTFLTRACQISTTAFSNTSSGASKLGALRTIAMAHSLSTSSLEKVSGDGIGGDGITLVPKGGEYKNVVVWLHGLGDTASGWASSMPDLRMKDTKFILPTAVERPITLNGGYRMPGWSDIIGLTEDSPEDQEGFDSSGDRVRSILDAERSKGKEDSRMVVGGFSQGGAVALHVCLRSTRKLAGCIACSSWVPLNEDYPVALGSAAKDIPVSQFHGTRDEMVRFTWGQQSHNLLKDGLGISAEFTPIAGMGHSASAEELEGVGDFLRKVLPE